MNINFFFLTLVMSFLPFTNVRSQNTLLWEISGNNLKDSSYLFGILKFIPKDEFYLPKTVVNKLKSSEILGLETSLDHHSRHELNKGAHLEDHQTLDDFLEKSEIEKLRNIFSKQLHVSDLNYNLTYKHFKPGILSTTMTRLSLKQNIKYYEFELLKIAKKNNLSIASLESIESELKALEKIPMNHQINALRNYLNNFDKQINDYHKLVKAYQSGDLENNNDYTMYPHQDYRKYFVDQRNKNWIPKIERYMNEGSTFFSVGVSHLSGENGLVKLLRMAGYSVNPIPLD